MSRDECERCHKFHQDCECPKKHMSDEEISKQWNALMSPKNPKKPKMMFDFDDATKELSVHDKWQVLDFIHLLARSRKKP